MPEITDTRRRFVTVRDNRQIPAPIRGDRSLRMHTRSRRQLNHSSGGSFTDLVDVPKPTLTIVPHITGNHARHFTISGTADPVLTRWDWDFGDGNTGSGSAPDHTYAAAGEYVVTLTGWSDWWIRGRYEYALTVADGESAPVPMDFYGVVGNTAGGANDGFVARDTADETYATIRSGVGNDFDIESPAEFDDVNAGLDRLQIYLEPWDVSDNWGVLRRAVLSFDFDGTLPSEPSSGSMFLVPKFDGFDAIDDTARLTLVTYVRGDRNAKISPDDYHDLLVSGATAASDTKPLVSSLITGVAVELPLNAAGIQYVIDNMLIAGPTWFGLRLEYDRSGSPTPSSDPLGAVHVNIYSADAVLQANRPRLHLEFD